MFGCLIYMQHFTSPSFPCSQLAICSGASEETEVAEWGQEQSCLCFVSMVTECPPLWRLGGLVPGLPILGLLCEKPFFIQKILVVCLAFILALKLILVTAVLICCVFQLFCRCVCTLQEVAKA